MKRLALLVLAIVAGTGANAQFYSPNGLEENIISVNGKAEREIVPDQIYLRIVISENDTKGKTSVDELEKKMVRALQNIGIDTEKNLKIRDMSSTFESGRWGRQEARTTADYQLMVMSGSQLSAAYDALTSVGISNTTITRVDHSKIKQFTDELRAEAVLNAKENAVSLANALKQNVGRAVYIADYGNGMVSGATPILYARAAGSADMAEYTPVDEFRTIKLSYTVAVKFTLE